MIELKDVHVKAGKFSLKHISLQINEGKFHVLLGPSGSGKTILLETIAGLATPASGCILINNKDVSGLPPEKRELSYLPQDHALFPHMNVFENIAFGLSLKKRLSAPHISEKVANMANMLNISNLLHRSIHHLSGGEQQRVALARALVLENKLLILDEPTSSLHETMQENFCLLLKAIQKKFSLTVLMTTHHKDSAFMLADTLHFIEEGKLFLNTHTSDLFKAPLPLRVAELLGITNIFTMKVKPEEPGVFFCPQINKDFILSNFAKNLSGELKLGVKPAEIFIIKKEEKHLFHINSFYAIVEQVFYKESNALIFLKITETGFIIKMELPVYYLHKMDIKTGITIQCKIKEEYLRIVY